MRISYDSFILSASGWRAVFAVSGNEEDFTPDIGIQNTLRAALMAETFAGFICAQTAKQAPTVIIATDTRPTGAAIADAALNALIACGIDVRFLGISAAPEIMSYAREADGFMYISASHNPVGHNGVKFGLNEGGVLNAVQANQLAQDFKKRCDCDDASEHATQLLETGAKKAGNKKQAAQWKQQALASYEAFTREVISAETDRTMQKAFFDRIRDAVTALPVSVVCDMNGSARTLSIDPSFLHSLGIGFYAINDTPGKIAHAIIPEPENLVYCAQLMKQLHEGTFSAVPGKHAEALLGYMPDCDGDRGNIVYWDAQTNTAEILKAQEVFALCVLAETAFLAYNGKTTKTAVVVNDPTSMRIEEITAAFGVQTVRAEVGEANVVNRARQLRSEGYLVRILGEGSNGGNITHPAAVRDPLNTIFALLKLLVLRDICGNGKKPVQKGLFHLWCTASGQENAYRSDFTLRDIIATLPAFTTTGVSETRALAPVKSVDHAALKRAYQSVFLREWQTKKTDFKHKHGITGWEAISCNGTRESRNVKDFGVSGKGGLKILFTDDAKKSLAFIWMRGSGTEPVFRILCDARGNNPEIEKELLAWHTSLLLEADAKTLAEHV